MTFTLPEFSTVNLDLSIITSEGWMVFNKRITSKNWSQRYTDWFHCCLSFESLSWDTKNLSQRLHNPLFGFCYNWPPSLPTCMEVDLLTLLLSKYFTLTALAFLNLKGKNIHIRERDALITSSTSSCGFVSAVCVSKGANKGCTVLNIVWFDNSWGLMNLCKQS